MKRSVLLSIVLRSIVLRSVVWLAGAVALPASAQVYKCTVDGKVTYAQTPCERGDTALLAVPAAAPADPAAARALREARRESGELEKQRHARAAAQEREDARTDRAAAARRQRCARLRLDNKLAEDEVRRTAPQQRDAARAKVLRIAGLMALECPA